MSSHVVNSVTQANSSEHLAVKTWHELGLSRVEPEAIVTLKAQQTASQMSATYRLEGVGPGGSGVIAKRCQQTTGVIEHTIYKEILPHLPIPTLSCYGFVAEPEGEFCWLFLEDAGSEAYVPQCAAQRLLAAAWLGKMHTAAASLIVTVQLPDRGPVHYLNHLRSARNTILQHFDNPALRDEDRELLRSILQQLDLVESNWSQVETFCRSVSRTLVHGDFVSKNVGVQRDDGRMILLPFDWETAGWGAPAADVLRIDLPAYWAAVYDDWPGVELQTLEQMAIIGQLFRGSLAPINWEAQSLAYEWVQSSMSCLHVFHTRLTEAIRASGWAG
ncbi:aminoglycoside phosphotransferase family protein [Chloroflexi bacterium TSY]|nr:aminoglycoside phosphotransferase family protein [Chloroflexi bacterium TSY]